MRNPSIAAVGAALAVVGSTLLSAPSASAAGGTTAGAAAQAHTVKMAQVHARELLRQVGGPSGNLRTAGRRAGGPSSLSEGGCGFVQRCVYFNRAEQAAIAGGSGFLITAALCVEVGPLCLIAGTIVAGAYAYLLFQRDGAICPTGKPKLKIRWFPSMSIYGCVD